MKFWQSLFCTEAEQLLDIVKICESRAQIKGEMTIVVEGAQSPVQASQTAVPSSISEHLKEEIKRTGTSKNEALKVVAKARGVSRREAYRLLLEEKSVPGFDEPAFKTPFDVSLVVQEDHIAVGNTPAIKEEALPGGGKRVRFATTQPLPTYLLAWAVGPFDAVGGAILGVIAGLVLGHAAFHAATLAGGETAITASKSLLVIEVYDLRTFDALTDMLRNLGTGRKIVDEVKEQQN